jgi:hypothetical protein
MLFDYYYPGVPGTAPSLRWAGRAPQAGARGAPGSHPGFKPRRVSSQADLVQGGSRSTGVLEPRGRGGRRGVRRGRQRVVHAIAHAAAGPTAPTSRVTRTRFLAHRPTEASSKSTPAPKALLTQRPPTGSKNRNTPKRERPAKPKQDASAVAVSGASFSPNLSQAQPLLCEAQPYKLIHSAVFQSVYSLLLSHQ